MSSISNKSGHRSVGRPREFNEDQVLESAMGVFWRKGYENTSMADLLKATGLHKGSLYQAFGDKHSLFIRSLLRYLRKLGSEVGKAQQNATSAYDGLRLGLHKMLGICCAEDGRNPGCLALNSLVEKGPDDPEVRKILEGAYAGRMEQVVRTVRACQHEGTMRNDLSAERIAGVIDMTLMGLAASLKGPVSKERAGAVIDDVLASMQPPMAA